MKDLIILVHGYDGKNSNNPNALCLFDMIYLLQNSFKINIITTSITLNTYKNKIEDGVEIHYLPLNHKKNGKLNFKEWGSNVLNLIYGKDLIKRETKLLTISFPFNILEVGLEIKSKYPELYWAVYELDPFAYNRVLRFSKTAFFYRFMLEKRIFKKCNTILLTHELNRQYSEKYYKIYNNKFKDVGIPILKLITTEETISVKNHIDIIYIGSFYKKVREPDYMLKTIQKLIDINDKIRFHIYGPPKEIIASFVSDRYKDNILSYGRVSKGVIGEAIYNADILTSVGNSIDNQLPSKVLEYIGTRKPIINFYRINNDTSNSYLFNYPLSCLVFEDWNNINDNVLKLNEFIIENRYNRVEEMIINKKFYNDKLEVITLKIIKVLNSLI